MNAQRLEALADAYRLPTETTEENLKTWALHHDAAAITYGEKVLVAGYFYQPNDNCYFAAIYDHMVGSDLGPDDPKDPNGPEAALILETVTAPNYKDEGHALQFAMLIA